MKITQYIEPDHEGQMFVYERSTQTKAKQITKGPIYILDKIILGYGTRLSPRVVLLQGQKYRLLERDPDLRGYVAAKMGWLEIYSWLYLLIDKIKRILIAFGQFCSFAWDELSFRLG